MLGATSVIGAVAFAFLEVDDDALSDSDVIVTILSWNAKHIRIHVQHTNRIRLSDQRLFDYRNEMKSIEICRTN